jgi:two-component system sensor histidine kinase UhpB
MSLRFRLNLFISLLFALIFIGGSVYVVDSARKSVVDEMEASSRLTLHLINIALISSGGDDQIDRERRVVEQIAKLESTRHLHIMLIRGDGPYQPRHRISTGKAFPINIEAPQWFVKLVQPPPMEFIHELDEPGVTTEILIRANPSDEITEVWNETRSTLILMVLFAVFANLIVYYTLGRGLAPIETILRGLEGIEQGDYKLRLPQFGVRELHRISEKFNLMAEVLERSQQENRFLTQRSLAIQENERRNLAHELHDELGQAITAIKAVAVSIEQQLSARDSASIREAASTIISVSNRMYDVARNMMRRLRPPALDELGLVTALQDMIDDWNTRHQDIFCYFSSEGDPGLLDEECKISLYRIVQESLTNIIKHARATTVKINLGVVAGENSQPGHVILNIEDDGAGFDPDKIRTGLGLLGMRERVEALNGTCSINAEPGRGVRITVNIPLGDKTASV